jgi:hypothetical protein
MLLFGKRKGLSLGMIVGIPASIQNRYISGAGVGACNVAIRRLKQRQAEYGVEPFIVIQPPMIVPPIAPVILNVFVGSSIWVEFTRGYVGATNYMYSLDGGITFLTFSPVQTTSPLIISGFTVQSNYSLVIREITSSGLVINSNVVLIAPTVASSSVTLKQTYPYLPSGNYSIQPLIGSLSSFYVNMDTDGGGWMLIYRANTPKRTNNVIPYVVNQSVPLGGKSAIKRVSYYFSNNGIWAWVSFDYPSSGMNQYDVPTGGSSSNVFVNTRNLYNMNVISNSLNVTNATNITGYIQCAPSDFGGSSLIPARSAYDIYNVGYTTTLGYGAFSVWNVATLECIFGWNGQNAGGAAANMGIGNNGSPNKDWTFVSAMPVNFTFQVYVQI